MTKKSIGIWILLLVFVAAVFAETAGAASAPKMGKGKYAGMVLIPAGPFTMGRNDGPDEEKPAHRVFLPAYYIDKNLVTWAEYLPFIQAKGPAGPQGEMYLDTDDPDAKIVPQATAGSSRRVSTNFRRAKWPGRGPGVLPLEEEEAAHRGAMGKGGAWNGWPTLPVGERQAVSRIPAVRGFQGPDGGRGQLSKRRQPVRGERHGGAGVGVDGLACDELSLQAQGRAREPERGGCARRAGGNSASLPDGMTATNREVVMPGRQATGHGYIGFRCAAQPPHST